ncbi:MAG: LacI family DNA-binding transcriptional regulator [candidate division FCPU426 bacterium]
MQEKNKVTIDEVARLAKVAKSTVSRVLNGGSASKKARLRVEEVVRQLGFSPSAVARNLSMGRTGVVGFVIKNLQEEWLYELLQGMEEQSSPTHTALMLGSLSPAGVFVYDDSLVQRWIAERRADGLIFAKAGKRELPLIRKAQAAGMPVALVGPDVDAPGCLVLRGRNEDAGRELARHLSGLGHRRIDFLGGPNESRDTLERLQGLKEGLRESGGTVLSVGFASYAMDDGERFAREWMSRPSSKRGSAVVAANDAMAIGLIHGLQEQGLRIPKDLSVTGFDDLPASRMLRPGLTTMRQQLRRMGSAAMAGIIQGLGQPKAWTGGRLDFSMDLMVRQSTGKPL